MPVCCRPTTITDIYTKYAWTTGKSEINIREKASDVLCDFKNSSNMTTFP